MLQKLCLLLILLGFFLVESKSQKVDNDALIALEDDFSELNINQNVYKKVFWQMTELPKSNFRTYFLNQFELNTDEYFVFLGKSYENKNGWVYFEMTNNLPHTKKLTLSTDKIKCDGLNVYYLQQDKLQQVYEIKRETPLEERAYANFDFAIPIQIESQDTLRILIESQRRIGFNELNLVLKDEQTYRGEIFPQLAQDLFLMLFGTITALLLTGLGIAYKQPLLRNLGLYLLSISVGFAILSSFHDTWTYPSWLELDASSMVQFGPNLGLITVFLFLFQARKKYKQKDIGFELYLYWFLIVVNTINAFLLLFTNSFNAYVTNSFQYYTVLVIFVCFYEVIRFTYFTKRFYFLAALTLGLGKGASEAFIRLFTSNDYPLIPLLDFTIAPFAILLLAIGGIREMRHELISKEKHENALRNERAQLEELRTDELESIGRNLHDSIGNTLASILGFLNLKQLDKGKVQKMLIEVIQDVRIISHQFVKDDQEPIEVRIELLVERFDEFSETNFTYLNFGSGKQLKNLESFRQNNLYHIIQELFSNVLKHSFATEVTLQISEDTNSVTITLEDDGVGISNDKPHEGIGLKNIHKRAELSNFKLTIDSSPKGTNTIIQIGQ